MEWPLLDSETFTYVTTPTAKQIWKRAIEGCLSDITLDHDSTGWRTRVENWRDRLMNCSNWRTDYRTILAEFTTLMAAMDNERALDVAQAGLDAVHDLLLYRIDLQTVLPAKDVFVLTNSFPKLETCTLVGSKAPDITFQMGLTNPQNVHDTLFGTDAIAQVNAWHGYGVMETSASVLAKTALDAQNIPSVVTKKKFVLLGCTSELGPAKSILLIPGATVLGIARGGKRLDELIDYVRYNSPDDTTFLYPKSPKGANGTKGLYPNGGADLLLQGPQIAQWIMDQTDKDNDELVIAMMAYMDGEAHVRVSAAMDLIVHRIMRQRSSHNTILWSYTSPATCMVLPPTAATEAQHRLKARPAWEKWTNTLSMGRWMAPSNGGGNTSSNDDIAGASKAITNNDYTIVNGIVSAQGPNYVLAKTIQQWRCMVAHYRDGQNVSAPFAPASRTSSMVGYDTVSTALEGMHFFEPMLAFDVGPASTLMAAIMISHLQLMNRPLPDMEESPFTIFWDGAVHGGVWSCPYTLESLSVVNYALGKAYYPKGYIPPGALPPPMGEVNENGEELNDDGTIKVQRMIDPDVLLTLTDSQYGEPMPDSVKERLEFM